MIQSRVSVLIGSWYVWVIYKNPGVGGAMSKLRPAARVDCCLMFFEL